MEARKEKKTVEKKGKRSWYTIFEVFGGMDEWKE